MFWGTLNNRCRIIIGTQKGTIILTTTHIKNSGSGIEGSECTLLELHIMTAQEENSNCMNVFLCIYPQAPSRRLKATCSIIQVTADCHRHVLFLFPSFPSAGHCSNKKTWGLGILGLASNLSNPKQDLVWWPAE